MTKLSIIVPVYKVAQYLCKCVDSLLAQDIPSTEYEIILVDDGSPDACPQICDEYAAAHENIRVVHRENGGLSAARNSGIEVAQGEYIMFVDSDDYIELNVLGTLIKRMKVDNLDVLRYNYQNVHEKGEVFVPFKTGKPYFDYSSEVVDGETFLNERLGYACYAVMFIIKRDLLVDSRKSIVDSGLKNDDCIFKKGIYFEDVEWTPRMLLKAKRVASTKQIVYNYLWREGSITLPTSPERKQKMLDDRIKLLHGFQEQRKLVTDDRWFKWHTAATTIAVLNTISTYPKQKREPYLYELKALDIFPLSTYRAVGNNKYKIRLANVSPSIYCKLMHIIQK